MIDKDATNQITKLHDTKEVSIRSIRFVGIALIASLAFLPIYLYEQMYITVITLSSFCIFLGVVLLLLKKGYSKHTKTIVIGGINIFLCLFCFTEGLKLGSHLYFFPFLFALPFLISSNQYNKEVVFYFFFTVACFCLSISLSPDTSIWSEITDEQYSVWFFMNSVSAIILSIVFGYLSIYFEQKYSTILVDQKGRTEDAMKARSQFLSQMGHELRTPMNGIIGATNLLAKQNVVPEQMENLGILQYCSNHMLELINNILDYTKIEAGKLEIHCTSVNLKQLLTNSVLPFYNRFAEKKVELKIEIDEALNEQVMIDEIRMIQILNNLISNALKFTTKGHVKLKVSCLSKEENSLAVHFVVEDTGIGIAKKDFHKVFESFEQIYATSTRKYEGTGLGLNIARRLLNLMDSTLELESEPGKGSQFSFSITLLRVSVEKHQSATASPVQQTDLSGMKILIAEDNLINMLIAKKMLEGWNVVLTTAENGLKALQSLALNADFNLILMDLDMPEMDGYTAIEKIRKLYPTIPVLAYTAALIDQEMYQDLKDRGFVDAVLKPCQPIELFSKIRQYAN